MKGLYFLAGLIAVLWLAVWTAQEGQPQKPGKRRWWPFDWRDDAPSASADAGLRQRRGSSITPPVDSVEPAPSSVPLRRGWRDRAARAIPPGRQTRR
ncbi:hypothetical protein [Acidiphilium sp.]|uniref:hypothetical protein n=1 Tax=Acidiphilium sp. TaxID=527 RepID=UPI003CFE6144